MDIVWMVIALLVLAAWLAALVHAVRGDGLGDREPPRSHPEDSVPGTRVFTR
ncbi:hypothetical protein [Cellulomonas wangsupingiae]|uniref:MetS family NSS transporter small subunit n=1 Tax=Cellulomonas wangsupingiae TaxID=2968085 RepID=A0ABY5K8B1_9CELL|nr:hypothetical protein [Cellulomonas wangsupingiae]MCC2334746.1 hypothetical protein [Cellulomonas wangsupingiae]MCM0638534.1 hypothetical protein [Cellulomonas wangsupingiae]UUI66298.1 hypothetical protein NP075_06165 [Cellulomonas wangsupingiae]